MEGGNVVPGIEEILEKIDIVEIVSSYLNLKRAGKNFKALCPFHHEKTPSFFVSPEKQVFHCFGCGIGGNVIKFLMNIEKVSYYEALSILAKKAGIEISRKESVKENVEKKKILKANEYAANLYNKILFSSYGKIALEYLYRRNLTDEHINEFLIGFAPSNNFLISKIEEEKLNKESFVLAALLNEEGKEDTFRNRIIFPIYNMKDEIIGFGGRAIDDEVMPKYLNIRENIVFNKSNSLYGINWSKEKIKSTGFVIFVEGYFDVLKMHINGLKNTIAPMGTAITELHLNLIKKLTDKILLLFDGDDPGIRATFRSLETIIKKGFDIKICMLPSGFDPDKFIDEYGVKSLLSFIEKSQDFVDFSISINSQIYNINNPKEKSTVIKETIKLISKIPDEIERYEFLKKLSEKMEIKIEILEEYLDEVLEKSIEVEYHNISNLNKNNQDTAEKFLLEIVMNDRKYLEKLLEWKGQLPEKIEKLIKVGEKLINKNIELTPSFLIGECEDEELSSFISSIAIKDNNKISDDLKEKIFNDCLKKLKKKKILTEIETYKKRMNEKLKNGIDYKEDLKEIQKLLYKLKKE